MLDKELEKIIKDCQRQKSSAQEELYKFFYEKMLRVCVNYTKDIDLARDYLQDGFIKAFQNIKKYNFIGSFEGWLKRVFINNILDDLKKKNVLKETKDDDVSNVLNNSSFNEAEGNLGIENIHEAMNLLPNKTKIVFTLFVVDGYSHKEISDNLSISIETSKWHVKEARNFFKTNFSNLRG